MESRNRPRIRSRLCLRGITQPAFGVLLLFICASMSSAAPAGVTNPYHLIPERNVFGLKPAPLPEPAKLPSAPLPKVTLTGIITLSGKRALLKVEFPAQRNQPARSESLILAEGQRDIGIEVVQVDEKASRVRLNNCGTIMEITFDKNLFAHSLVGPAPPIRNRQVWARPPVRGWAQRY